MDNVVDVLEHDVVGPQSLVDVVDQLLVFNVVKVLEAKVVAGLLDPGSGQGNSLGWPVDLVVAVVFIVIGVIVTLVFHQLLDKAVSPDVVSVGLFSFTGNDQRRPRFVDQDGVNFVDDGVVKRPLHHLFLVDNHVVPEVVKAQFRVS